ncbi:MAG: tetratricopeptide repeat protein [Euryarchaeota archaeon]|nr:tetratricopeptide repeat protein [Euryarchaeota archaeon]
MNLDSNEYPPYKDEIESAIALFYGGNVEEAISKIDDLIREHGEQLDLVIWKTYMLALSGNPDSAYEYIKDYEDTFKDHAEYWTQRGFIRLFMNDLFEAQEDFKKALEIDPKSYHATIGHAYVLYQLSLLLTVDEKDLENALSMLAERRKDGFDTGELHTLIGLIKNALGRKKEALGDLITGYLKGVKEALSTIVDICESLGDYSPINKLLESGISYEMLENTLENIGDYDSYLILATRHLREEYSDNLCIKCINIAFNVERYDIAEDLLNLFIERHPEDIMAKRLLGEAYVYQGELNKGLEILLPLQENFSGDSTYLNVLGYVYYSLGKPEVAYKYFLDSIKADPNNASAWTNLGIYHYEMGDTSKAKEYLEKAIALNPELKTAKYYLMAIYKEIGDEENYRRIKDSLEAGF